MTSVQSHYSQTHTSTNGPNLDNNLDALLDDLQTSVSRPHPSSALSTTHDGALLNGGSFAGHHVNLPPGATGYREITTTVTQETNGVPMTSRDYQIEYLNPANSVTVLDERSSTPGLELLKSDVPGQPVASFKKQSYGYQYSEKSSTSQSKSSSSFNQAKPEFQSIDYPQDKSYQYSRTENYKSGSNNVNKNLNELDVLLKELNNTNSTTTTGYTPRTPTASRRAEQVQRTVETRVERSPARSYVDSSAANRSSSFNREENYLERRENELRPARASSPGVNPGGSPILPKRTVDVKTEINKIERSNHVSRRDSPSNRDRGDLSPTLRRRTPSPTSGEFRPATFSSYPLSPKETATSRTVVSKTYNYSSTGRRTPTPTSFDDQQPYRSPSPISFPAHPKRSPSPVRKNVQRSDSGRNVSYQVSPHITGPQLSDPNSPTVITYKYTSTSRESNRYPGTYEEREYVKPKPFPTTTPIPIQEQNPPKKLDELMASFQDSRRTYQTEYRSARETERTEREAVDLQRSPSFERNLRPSNVKATQVYSPQQMQQHYQPVTEVVPPPTPPPQKPKTPPATKSVSGPPVYYPPGVELFTKKEEMMEQQSAGGKGKMKQKGKMKYKYEASEKSKEKSSKGMAAVPVCLPVCCAMPCVIM